MSVIADISLLLNRRCTIIPDTRVEILNANIVSVVSPILDRFWRLSHCFGTRLSSLKFNLTLLFSKPVTLAVVKTGNRL